MPAARIVILFILLTLVIYASAQRPSRDSLAPVLTLGKRISWDLRVDEQVFGRSSYAFHQSFFMDQSLHLNNRVYIPCGIFYSRMQSYCSRNNITYDREALASYRKASAAAVSIYVLSIPVLLIPAFRLLDFPPMPLGKALFLYKGQYVFWALGITQIVVACKIKGKAERKLRKELAPGMGPAVAVRVGQ